MLSPSEIVELGIAKIKSQAVAQNAGIDAAFRGFFDESATDGEWKNWIYERPDHSDSLVFDWRLGPAEVMELIASRLTIIGVTSPDNFQSRSEYAVELNQYRDTLQALYDKMVNDGIRCGVGKNYTLTTVCADIHTGLAVNRGRPNVRALVRQRLGRLGSSAATRESAKARRKARRCLVEFRSK